MRRIARLLFTPELLLLMGCGRFEIIRDPVPEDAKVIQTTIDPMSGCIQLFIESQEFGECPDGMIPFQLNPPMIRKLADGEHGSHEKGSA